VRLRVLLVLPVLLALAGCGGAPPLQSEPPEAGAKAAEERIAPPAYPKDASLLEFSVLNAGGFRFFVDGASLSVAQRDGEVRYVLVARSPEGAQNVSYEGLSCAAAQYRIYSVGRPDASWAGRPGEWRALSGNWHRVLYREYFCPQNEPIRNAAEGVRALEQGGHPFSQGFGR
jgi:hypothetical protein